MAELEWYTLDDSLRRDRVIEDYESFIWTERYSDVGDFQIITRSTRVSRGMFVPGVMIAKRGSYYVMVVDTVSDETEEDGTRNLTVTGKSLEALLNDRVAMPSLTDTTTQPAWVISGTPGDIIREMFTTVCVTGALSPLDTIPFYHSGTLLPTGSLGEDASTITVTAQPDTLFSTIKKIADTYSLGFRFVRNGDAGEIYFEVYTGNDLTSDQVDRNPVIFDSDMDNLEKVSILTSSALVKTVAYVFAQNGATTVFSTISDPDASGAGRRVLLVNSSNDGEAGGDLTAALQAEGLLALGSQKFFYGFSAELPQELQYQYGVDYSLGDLVEERTSGDFGNQMLVTEQIFISDDQGNRAYPTLIIQQVITPGTWLVEDPDEEWLEVPPDEHWLDL